MSKRKLRFLMDDFPNCLLKVKVQDFSTTRDTVSQSLFVKSISWVQDGCWFSKRNLVLFFLPSPTSVEGWKRVPAAAAGLPSPADTVIACYTDYM